MNEPREQFVKLFAQLKSSAFTQGLGGNGAREHDPARVKKLFKIAGLSEPTDNELNYILG